MPGCSDFAEFIPMKLLAAKGSGGRAPFPFADALFPQAGRVFAMRQHLLLLWIC